MSLCFPPLSGNWYQIEKKVPEKGDENGYCFVILINSSGVNIEKSPQERGRKRILVFIQFIDFH